MGGRTTNQGYSQVDGARQRYTGAERDDETGLDFMQARYYGSSMGRFTSPDPLLSSGELHDPQTWNRYAYALNNPLLYTDPLGLFVYAKNVSDEQKKQFEAALKQGQDNLKKVEAKYGKDSDQYTKAAKALNSYGDPGKDNGVVVSFDRKEGGGYTEATKDAKGKVVGINVQFNAKELESNSFQALVGHEGSHVDYFQTEKGFNRYDFEFRGHYVQSVLGEAQFSDGRYSVPDNNKKEYDLWNKGWEGPERETLRRTAINTWLAVPIKEGSYGLKPPTPRQSSPRRRRRP